MKFLICRLIKVGVLMAACNTAVAQKAVEFNSLSSQDGFAAIYRGEAKYTDKINGVFTRPSGVVGDVPVMVIMHSSAGVSEASTGTWSKHFLEMGIATFVVDSFTPRGLKSSWADQSVLTDAGSAADALKALEAVSKIPGVDSKRIGVIGFSRGGIAALHTSLKRVNNTVMGKNSPLKFALHIAFYPACVRYGTSNGQPTLIVLGEKDPNHSIASCQRYVDVLKERGAKDVSLVVYPGAYHGFDFDHKDSYNPKIVHHNNCKSREEDLDNMSYFVDGVKVLAKDYLDYSKSCSSYGMQVGYNRTAAKESRALVADFVRKNFAM
jgi:dienelactone hydrolase